MLNPRDKILIDGSRELEVDFPPARKADKDMYYFTNGTKYLKKDIDRAISFGYSIKKI